MHPPSRVLCLLTLAVLLLPGCSQAAERRSGWSGSETPGRLSYSYRYFTGRERAAARLQLGQLLTLDYDATVTRGRLVIRVVNPEQDILWQVSLAAGARDHVELLSVLAGTYAVEVLGEGTAGSFDVQWTVTSPDAGRLARAKRPPDSLEQPRAPDPSQRQRP